MASPESAEHVQVLSAGAPKGGVSKCAEVFSRETAHRVAYRFATAPVLRAQVEAGEAEADVVVAPVPSMQAFENDVALLEVLLATAAPAQSDLGWRVFLDGKKAWEDHNSTFSREHLADFAAPGTIREVEAEITAEIEAAFDRVRAIQFSSIPL